MLMQQLHTDKTNNTAHNNPKHNACATQNQKHDDNKSTTLQRQEHEQDNK